MLDSTIAHRVVRPQCCCSVGFAASVRTMAIDGELNRRAECPGSTECCCAQLHSFEWTGLIAGLYTNVEQASTCALPRLPCRAAECRDGLDKAS